MAGAVAAAAAAAAPARHRTRRRRRARRWRHRTRRGAAPGGVAAAMAHRGGRRAARRRERQRPQLGLRRGPSALHPGRRRGGWRGPRGGVAPPAIACDWTEGGRLHGAVGDAGMRALEQFMGGADALGEPYRHLDRDALAAVTGTTYYRAGGHTPGSVLVQPAALVRGLARTLPGNVDLFEESPVRSIASGAEFELQSDAGMLRAPRLFVATNGFTPALGLLRDRMFPLMTFGSLTRPLTPAEAATLGGEPVWGVVSELPMGTPP